MNRQLSCLIDNEVDSPVKLAEELVQHGFIHPLDSGAIQVQNKTSFDESSQYHSKIHDSNPEVD